MGSYMGVSKNSGTPKSSILIGFSIINHPFLGYPYFWKHPYQESWPSFKPLNGNTLPDPTDRCPKHRGWLNLPGVGTQITECYTATLRENPGLKVKLLVGYMRNCLCHVGTVKMPGDIVSWKHHFSGLHVKSHETHSKKLWAKGIRRSPKMCQGLIKPQLGSISSP